MNIRDKISFNIVLCGFMGSGKTTVGKRLSIQTGLNFIDTDRYIEKKSGLTVSEIFGIYGESYFRKLEKDCIRTISASSPNIISTGGGMILNLQNVFCLKQTGKIFYLDTPINVITDRLSSEYSRPLLKNESSIKKIFDERKERYFSAADFIINADQSVDEVCKDIFSKIEKTAPK